MIISHTFGWYYGGQYNGTLTITSQTAFVFLAGFTSAVLYSRRLQTSAVQIKSKLFIRSYRFMALFILLNLFIFTLRPDRLHTLIHRHTLPDILFRVILLGADSKPVSFEMLVPIALTCLASWFLIRHLKPKTSLLLALCCILSLFIIEVTRTFNYYGVRYTTIGTVGCLLGIFISPVAWDNVQKRIMKRSTIVFVAICSFTYYTLMCLYTNRHTPLFYSLHFFPTVLNLVLMYQLGSLLPLASDGLLQRVNALIAENMLFAYVAHLMIIYLISSFLPVAAYPFSYTMMISAGVGLATVAACSSAVWCSKRFTLARNAYSYLFK